MESIPDPGAARTSLAATDLIAFGSFFLLTLIFLPSLFVAAAGAFIPGISFRTLSGEAQLLLQAVLDLAWVGFILFLIKTVHRTGIREFIRWVDTRTMRRSRLIALGAALALAVFLVSSFFPPSSTPPIEQLVESTRSIYLLVIFGTCFAPLVEEIMFRGFLFHALSELGGSRLAVPATAVLFAILHAPQLWPSLAGIILIFGVGYILSLVRERSNSLIPSFIVHTAYNSALVGASALATILQHGR